MTDMTPGGSQIHRHEVPSQLTDEPAVDAGLRAALEAHFDKYLPTEPQVLHEIVSQGIHLDVYVYPPCAERPAWTLVTMGMSEHPMNAPAGAEDWRRCELISTLPADWPMPSDKQSFDEVFSDPANYWPIGTLKWAARLPVAYDTWLCHGHTLAAGESEDYTYEGSEFSGMLLAGPCTIPDEASSMVYQGERIWFWGVYPLYADEMALKLDQGTEALLDLFDQHGVYEGVLPGRGSVVR